MAFGARPLKRVLQREVANPLAQLVLGGLAPDGSTVTVDADAAGGVTLDVGDAPPAEAASPDAPQFEPMAPAAEA